MIGTGSYIAAFLATTGTSRWRSFTAEISGELHLSAERMASSYGSTRTLTTASLSLTNGRRHKAANHCRAAPVNCETLSAPVEDAGGC
jgi:hypothetical protein